MAILKTINNGTSGEFSAEEYRDKYQDFEEAVASSLECLNEGIQMVDDLNTAQEAMECIKKFPNDNMGAMESFLGVNVGRDYRLVSMEGDDTEKTLVQKIKEWFKIMWARFQDFFNKFSLFAQACSKKLGAMTQKLSNDRWNAEKLKGNDTKCLTVEMAKKLDKDVIDAADVKIQTASATFEEINTDKAKMEQALDDTLKLEIAKALLSAHKTLIDNIVASKQKVNASLKAAMDSIKIAQNGADRETRGKAYRQARINYHVALKNIHIISSTAVRSANKLLAACAKAYKAGVKEALA